MAINILCDICGNSAVSKVQVSIISAPVIAPDQPTGTAMEQYLCVACRHAAIITLSAQAQANLEAVII